MYSSGEAAILSLQCSERIRELQARINALHGEQLAEIDRLDRAHVGALGTAFPDATREEIALDCRLTGHGARTRLDTARALAGRLHHTRDQLAAGRLSLEHAHAMARATAGLTVEKTLQVEAEVLDDTRAVTAGQLGFRARVAAQRLLEPTVERAVARGSERSLTAFRQVYGGVCFSLLVPESDAAVLEVYLGATAGRQGADDERPVDERRADAMLELVRSALDSGHLPSGGDGRKPHVEITTTVEGLREGSWQAAGVGGRFVLSGQLRELACDADVRTTLLDRDHCILDQGRTTRVVSSRLRGRLEVRDTHCRFPGCDVRAPRCRAHHIRHWADGGPTDQANLLLVCERHHHAIHDGGWQVALDLDQVIWTSPLGRSILMPGDLAPQVDEFLADPDLIRPWHEFLMVDPDPPFEPPSDPPPCPRSDPPPESEPARAA